MTGICMSIRIRSNGSADGALDGLLAVFGLLDLRAGPPQHQANQLAVRVAVVDDQHAMVQDSRAAPAGSATARRRCIAGQAVRSAERLSSGPVAISQVKVVPRPTSLSP